MNLYLKQELYNEDFKLRYLETHEKATSRYYKYVFQRSAEMESKLNKDVYGFTTNELDTLVMTYENGTLGAIQSVVAVLRGYINFAIKEGFVKNRINYLEGLSGNEDYKKYLNINKIKNRIITKDELINICNSCENAQDAICFALPFYGVKGQGNEEMLNLKVSDVDFTHNILKLKKDDGSFRNIKVDDFLTELIFEATEEESYVKENGGYSDKGVMQVNKNEYVLRTGGKKHNEKAHMLLPNTRIKRVGRVLGNNKLTPMTIWYSGIYHRYLEIKANKEVTNEDYKELCKEFNFNDEYFWKIKDKMKEYDGVSEM